MSQPRVASMGASRGRPRLRASHTHSRGSTSLPIACAQTKAPILCVVLIGIINVTYEDTIVPHSTFKHLKP